jgi:hypothetical protein
MLNYNLVVYEKKPQNYQYYKATMSRLSCYKKKRAFYTLISYIVIENVHSYMRFIIQCLCGYCLYVY